MTDYNGMAEMFRVKKKIEDQIVYLTDHLLAYNDWRESNLADTLTEKLSYFMIELFTNRKIKYGFYVGTNSGFVRGLKIHFTEDQYGHSNTFDIALDPRLYQPVKPVESQQTTEPETSSALGFIVEHLLKESDLVEAYDYAMKGLR